MRPKQGAVRRSTRSQEAASSSPKDFRKRSSFTATEAKNEFGQLLERAIRGETVVITKHDAPKAVLISIDEYKERYPEAKLDSLSAEFDAMFERMQTPQARKAMDRAFHSTPEELGDAALAAAKRRG